MKRHFATLVMAAALTMAQQPAHAIESANDYLELSPVQPTDVKRGQIEVIEFFWYRCPHCFDLESELNAWAKKLPKDVVLKRVPGILNPGWAAMARAFYALEALGLREKLHDEVFDAIHVRGMDLEQPERFFDWAVTKGVDRKKLADAYNSFSVNSQVMRAQQMTAAFKINGVPAFAVNGKYVTSAYMAGSVPAMFKTLDELIAQERKKNGRR